MTETQAPAETFDDLVADCLPVGMSTNDYALSLGLNPKSMFRLRSGQVAKPRPTTMQKLSAMRHHGEPVSTVRIRAAIARSRLAYVEREGPLVTPSV